MPDVDRESSPRFFADGDATFLGRISAFARKLAGSERAAPGETAPDGLAFPPASLIKAVAGTSDRSWFWEGGALGAETVVDLLARRGIALEDLDRVLDFGCGCGRVLRHLRARAPGRGPRLYGSDYNRKLVKWCRRSLPFAEVATNRLHPPIRYTDGMFDLIYAFSVFTHLTVPLQRAWMDELHRVLRPGGLLIISVHGDFYLDQLSGPERDRYQSGESVVWSDDGAGTNRCAAFHSERCVREQLTRGFEVLEFAPEGARGNPRQDAYLLSRK